MSLEMEEQHCEGIKTVRYVNVDIVLHEIHRLTKKYHGCQIAYDVLRCVERKCKQLAEESTK